MSIYQSKSFVSSNASNQLSSLATIGDKRDFKWKESFIFPLFTELNRFIHLPNFIFIIELIILFIQEIGITMWCGSKHMDIESDWYFGILYSFADWRVSRLSSSDYNVQYAIAYVLFFFTNLFLVFVSIYYEKKRVFVHSHLTIVKFILYPLLTVLLPVYASFFGKAFVEVSQNSSSLSIFHFVFLIIVILVSFIELRFAYLFSTNTPLLDRSLLGSWDDSIVFVTILSMCYGTFLSQTLDLFSKWLHVAAIVGYICFLSYRIYLLYFVPMLTLPVNTFFLANCLMSIFNLILSIVHLYISSIASYGYILISIFSFFAGLVFSNWWFKKKHEALMYNLTYRSSIDNDPNEYKLVQQHFSQIIFSSERDAISYLHMGVALQSERIIDTSFLRYLISDYNYPSMVFAVAQVASFFPSQPQFINALLKMISKYKDLSIAQMYLLNQIRRIHLIRQSTVSWDASMQFSQLQKMSRDTISQVRGFWGEILNAKSDISFASLHYLRSESIKADSAFLDACDQYPSNTKILNEYCRFQIEALGNFQGATSSGRKMIQINQGKNLVVDYAFKALVNVYPQYLVNNHMNIHGEVISKPGLDLTNTSTNSLSTSATTDSSDRVEIEEKYEQIISQLYSHNKLRVALQNRMKTTRLKSLIMALALSIIQLLVYVVIYLFLIIFLPKTCQNSNQVLQCCYEVSKMALNLEYIGCISAVQLVISKYKFGGVSIMKQLLNIKTSDMNQDASLLTQPFRAMSRAITEYKTQYESCLGILMGDLHSYTDHFSGFYNETTEYHTNTNSYNSTLRASLVYYLYIAETIASYITVDEATRDLMSEVLQNINTIYFSIQNFLDSISLFGESKLVKDNNIIRISSLFVVIALFIGFAVARIINIILIFKEAKECSDLLRQTNPQVIKESYKPLSLKNSKEVIIGNNVHSAHDLNYCMIAYPFLICVALLVNAVFLLLSTFLYCNELDMNKKIYTWLSDSTIQFSSLFNSLNTICAKSAELISIEDGNELLSMYIDNLTNSHVLIDMTLMGANETFNDFYFVHHNEIAPSTEIGNFAHYLASLSLSNKINIAASSLQTFAEQNPGEPKLNNNNFASLVFIIDMFLYDDLLEFQDILIGYSQFHFEHARTLLLYFTISGLIICLLMYLMEQIFIRTFIQSVDAMKQLIAMLPPVPVVTSTPLMNFLNNGRDFNADDVVMSVYESIISSTSNAAVLLDTKYVIQVVNSAVHDLTGFTPDQILGQPISFIFPLPQSDNNEELALNTKLYEILDKFQSDNDEQMKPTLVNDSSSYDVDIDQDSSISMINNNSTSIKTKCMTENGSLLPTQVTILHISGEFIDNDQYALILRDLSKEQHQRKEIEEAKEKSEKLFNALFPVELLSLKKEFKVEFGTVILIELSGLTDYVRTLPADRLIFTIKTIYNAFEKQTEKYPSVRIIKKDSGMLLACLGLFDYVSTTDQAIQSVMYCNAMIDEIALINEESDTDIHIKIGINSGGPLFGRVIGEENPVFEILGPVIELASQMQSEGEPDVIQISETTMKFLDSSRFNIEKEKDICESDSIVNPVYTVVPI